MRYSEIYYFQSLLIWWTSIPELAYSSLAQIPPKVNFCELSEPDVLPVAQSTALKHCTAHPYTRLNTLQQFNTIIQQQIEHTAVLPTKVIQQHESTWRDSFSFE